MIIVPQRGIDVNRKEEKIMKVKVRKRKPAPVAEEQAPKAIYIVKRELNGKFGVPHHVEFDDYTASAHQFLTYDIGGHGHRHSSR